MRSRWVYIVGFSLASLIATVVHLQLPGNVRAESTLGDIFVDHAYTRFSPPTEAGIEVELGIYNAGPGIVLITEGAQIIQFDNGLSVNAEQSVAIDSENYHQFSMVFDSDSLAQGLNTIDFVVDPENLIEESDEANNYGTLKLFHPDAYPDLIIEELEITPNPVVPQGVGPGLAPVIVRFRVRNVGGDMPRTTMHHLTIAPGGWNMNYAWDKIPPLLSGETYERSTNAEFTAGFMPDPTTVVITIVDFMAQTAIEEVSNIAPWDSSLQNTILPYFFQPGEFYDLSAPLELGSEQVELWGLFSSWNASNLANVDYSGNNNLAFAMVPTSKPVPYVLYPTDGKRFEIGAYPPIRHDWNQCMVDCIPAPILQGDPTAGTMQEWKAGWVDSQLRFRWLPDTESGARLEIYDMAWGLVHKAVIDEATLNANGEVFRTGRTMDETPKILGQPGRHDQAIYNFWVDVWGKSQDDVDNMYDFGVFGQYVYDGPALKPGVYRWRVKFDHVDAPDEVEPWSPYYEFVILPDESEDLEYLDQPGFFGNVAEVGPDRFRVSTNPEVVLLITDATVINNPGAGSSQALEVGQRVAVIADQLPAIGVDVSDAHLATALTVTVIPKETLRQHRLCAVVEQVAGNATLACEDGTTVEVSAWQLDPGDSVVMLFQPQKPAQLVTTATELLGRLNRIAEQAADQGNEELASDLISMGENTEKSFAAKFKKIRDVAPPDLKALMDEMRSSVTDLAEAAVDGGDEVVLGTETVAEVISNIQQMLASIDQMTEMVVNSRLSNMSEKSKEVAEELVRSQAEESMGRMQEDMEETLTRLQNGDLEGAISLMNATTRWMEEGREARSIRDQVEGLLDQLQAAHGEEKEDGAGRKPPEITLQCPSSAYTSKNVECSFRYSGKVESITWSIPSGSPSLVGQANFTQESPEKNLSIAFDVAGTHEITLEACNKNGCTMATHTVVVEPVPEASESE